MNLKTSKRQPITNIPSFKYWGLLVLLSLSVTLSVSAKDSTEDKDAITVTPEIQALIQRAGNADTDVERLELLQKIQEIPGLDPEFKYQLDTLVRSVHKWTYDDDIRVWSPFYPLFVKPAAAEAFEGSPLYPILLFYKARYRVWNSFQTVWNQEDKRKEEFAQARGWLQEAIKSFPENKILRMYLGQPYPFPIEYYGVPGAPEWAIYQRECLELLTDIALWWIENRQRPDGSFGGGWDDDVEMWRKVWMPMLIPFYHPKLEVAQDRLSRGSLAQESVKDGYSNRPGDVEHVSEMTADAITVMMFLQPEDPEWNQRALRLAELMEELWTGINDKGFRQFKSTYYSVDSVVLAEPRKACATAYDARAIQPTLLYWQRTGDPEVGKLLLSWIDGWLEAAKSSDRGKPSGVVPSAIHWPDGNIGGLGENWWRPENYTKNPLYGWPGNTQALVNSILLAWYMTRDDKYLSPIRKMADMRLKYLKKLKKDPQIADAPAGSKDWVGANLSMMEEICAKYRILTGSKEFDALLNLGESGNRYARYITDKDPQPMAATLHGMAESLRNYYPGYTTECRWTDRIIRFQQFLSLPAMYDKPIEGITSVGLPTGNIQMMYSMTTGDPTNGQYFPINAVRWKTLSREIAVLVNQAGFDEFEAELFHFGTTPRQMEAEFYLLDQGTYTLSLIQKDTQKVLESRKVQVDGKKTSIPFTLPSQELCVLRID